MAFIGTPLDTRNTFQSLAGKRFNGDGSTTAFTLDVAPSSTLDIEVFVGNVRQDPNSAYTLSGTTLTFTGAPPSGTNNIYVVHQAKSVGTIDPPAVETVAKQFNGGVVFNEDSADLDFRVESNGNANMLFISGGNDVVGVGAEGDLGVGLHVKSADTTASAVSGSADELVIEGTGNVGMTVQSANDGVGNIYFGDVANGSIGRVSYDHSSNFMSFNTNASERMRIDSSGDIYVGKTTGGQNVAGIKLEGSSGTVLATRDQAVAGIFTRLNNDGEVVRIMSNTSTVGTISISGSSTAYNTSSDYRLKENEVAISDGIERLKQLKPYRFNFKANADKTVDGFFAHEVSSIVPEAISGEKDAVDSDNNPIHQGIDQSKLVPLLTKALQEAITEIESLKARVTTLEG